MKILIAGDFCPQHRVSELFSKGNFESVLSEVNPIVRQADYSIVNLECPVTMGNESPILKQGPNLQCSEKGVEAIQWAGFDCVTLANNHFLDYGEQGVENTLQACRRLRIDTVGGGMNLEEASTIFYKEIVGSKLAVINCCEHEFSIATEISAGSNPLNPIQQYYAIQEAKKKSDYVLVIVHGGSEHYQLPSPRMQETYRFFVDAGADAVVNHHQHCFSGYEIYKGKPICYGLGNFCFDKNKMMRDTWYEGILCEISFKNEIELRMIPYQQCKIAPSVGFNTDSDILERIEILNYIISNNISLNNEYKKYIDKTKATYINSIEQYGRIGVWLRRKGLIKSSLRKRNILAILNNINCESHLDRFRCVIGSLLFEN